MTPFPFRVIELHNAKKINMCFSHKEKVFGDHIFYFKKKSVGNFPKPR